MRVVFIVLAAALAKDVTPVEKVIGLLGDLQQKVSEEGLAEVKTYNEFACFCKDESAERTKAINEGSTEVGRLTGSLAELTSNQNTTMVAIADTQEDIKNTKNDIAVENRDFQSKTDKYNGEHKDMKVAIEQCENAVQTLQASRPSLVQMQAVLARTMTTATSFGLEPATPTENYAYHGNKIILTLKGLCKDFRSSKHDLQKAHINTTATHDQLQQANHDSIQASEKSLNDHQKFVSEVNENIAKDQQSLTRTQMKLMDDQRYLKDLSSKCTQKKKVYDQRAAIRTEELNALTTAMTIMKGAVHEHESLTKDNKKAKTDRAFDRTRPVHEKKELLQDDEEEMSENDDEDSFVQVAKIVKHTHSFLQQRAHSPTVRAADVLMAAGKRLGSHELSALAMRAAEDPMGRVKQMIEKLVQRLLSEQDDEANHKGWCDSQLSAVKQKRDQQNEKIKALSSALHSNEANRDRLHNNLNKLDQELADISAALKKATDIRNHEQSENTRAMEDAKFGLVAVNDAVEVLKQFYNRAADEQTPSFLEQDPEAGISQAYQGDQDTAVGIFGMMEVIVSDFQRVIDETNQEEDLENQEFLDLKRSLESSQTAKETTHQQLSGEFSTVTEDMNTQMESLREETSLFNQQIEEWESLKAACVNRGVSYDNRKGKREEEITALKQALCILEGSDDC